MEQREEYRGFWFSINAPKRVRDCIANAYLDRPSGIRIRIHLGDAETGRIWLEKHDVIGYIGRSTGSQKIPLLIHNRRSIGGSAILDHCILGIQEVTTKQWLYKADNFTMPVLYVDSYHSQKPVGYEYVVSRDDDKNYQAAFKTFKESDNYIRFMRGERMRVN